MFEVKVEIAGRVIKFILSTLCRDPNEAEVRIVRLCRFKEPVMDCKESAAKEVNFVALNIVSEPFISLTLAKAAVFKPPPMVRFPTSVSQPLYLSKSLCAVAVACELIEQEEAGCEEEEDDDVVAARADVIRSADEAINDCSLIFWFLSLFSLFSYVCATV